MALQLAASAPALAQRYDDDYGSSRRPEWSPYRGSARSNSSEDYGRRSYAARERSELARSVESRYRNDDDDRGDLPVVIGTLTPTIDDRDDPRMMRRSQIRLTQAPATPAPIGTVAPPGGTVLTAPQYPISSGLASPQPAPYSAATMNPGCAPAYPGPTYAPTSTTSIYARFEYLLWWLQGTNTPPLVTSAPAASPSPVPGALGNSDTSIQFGGQRLNTEARSGGRVTLGGWFNQRTGLEGEYFVLGDSNQRFETAQFGTVFRPFYATVAGGGTPAGQGAIPVTYINVTSTSSFQGASVYLMRNLLADMSDVDRGYRLDILGGYSFLNLHETLTIRDSFFGFVGFDQFKTTNYFNGADLGAQGEFRWRRWTLSGTGRVGLGVMSESVTINGATNVGALIFGHILTQPTNIGAYQRTLFAVVPRIGTKLGFNILPGCKLHVGYDLLYCNEVVRPGNQIDVAVNPTTTTFGGPPVGQPRPAFAFAGTDLWAQGMDAGVEFRY